MKYDIEIVKKVVEEFNENPNKLFLSKKYNIPRATLRYWLDPQFLKKKEMDLEYEESKKEMILDRIKNYNKIYSFILGLYLGDGCITKNKMSYRLRIVQDEKYTNSIIEIEEKMNLFFEKKSSVTKQTGCTIVSIFDKYLLHYFPQHGLGKKHERLIELSEFQLKYIDYQNLMRGLFISDGSYYLANKKYERFNFTNKSLDIINIFRDCLNHFDISHGFRVKPNGIYIVEIQRKSEVAKMKNLVGIKS